MKIDARWEMSPASEQASKMVSSSSHSLQLGSDLTLEGFTHRGV